MKLNINVFCLCVILVLLCKHNCRLIICEQSDGRELNAKDLRNEHTKPQCFLHCVSSRNIFALSG